MGMSASQARLLSITARLADTELQGQQIANAKIRLASESDSISQAYLEALQGTSTKTTTNSVDYKTKYANATMTNLAENGLRVRTKDGLVASNAANATAEQKELYTALNSNNNLLTAGLFKGGNLIMQQQVFDDDGNITWQDVSVNSTAEVVETTNDEDVAVSEAEYNAKLTKIENKEKILDMELNKIDTEHQALQTEYDSVKKVIEKNIERTFKIFS